jgi:hypothetical protein
LDSKSFQDESNTQQKTKESSPQLAGSIWAGFLSLIKPQASADTHHQLQKTKKIYYRGQIRNDSPDTRSEQVVRDDNASSRSNPNPGRKAPVRGSSLYTNDSQNEDLEAPPKTTFFESAGDLLNPPLPPKEYLIDPEARARTIFHDRIYHPEDIPPPPTKRQRSFMKSPGSRDGTPEGASNEESTTNDGPANAPDPGSIKIEEKIARAYHKDLSWRKVLVRLEPDAHNNMVVRRMFANAYGWPVIKHLCDTHFAYTAATQVPDEQEPNEERAKASDVPVGKGGEEVRGQTELPDEPVLDANAKARARSLSPRRSHKNDDELHKQMHKLELRLSPPRQTTSELRESTDGVNEIVSPTTATATAASSYSSSLKPPASRLSRQDSAKWSDRFFEGSEDDSDEEAYLPATINDRNKRAPGPIKAQLTQPEIADVLTQSPNEGAMTLPLTTEPEPLKPTKREADGGISSKGALGLTNIGLQKKVEERMTPAQKWTQAEEASRKAHPSLGVVEKVAIARAKNMKDEDLDGTT